MTLSRLIHGLALVSLTVAGTIYKYVRRAARGRRAVVMELVGVIKGGDT